MSSKYIVKVSSAHMPSSCWGRYVRVAVLEVAPGVESVAMISDRARGVKRVVATWEKRSVGKTARSASERALAEAHELAESLNAVAARDVQ